MNRGYSRVLIVALAAAGAAVPDVRRADAADWPFWRGPEQNGFAREDAVVKSWSPDGENLLWKVPVEGRTTPIIMGGRMFVIGPVGRDVGRRERITALDAETGKTLWTHDLNVFHTDIVENRVGWTALAGDPETGNVYAHATGGELIALSRDGQVLWSRSLTEEFGRISGYGGRLHTPIVDENRLIISFSNSSWGDQAAPRHRLLAMDKNTGKPLWWAGPGEQPIDPTCYSTPVVAVVDGVRMLVFANGEGVVYGLRARTGEELWRFCGGKRGYNVSPVVEGSFVYVGHSEENHDNTEMGRVVCLDATKRGDITESGEVWRADGLTVGYSSPAVGHGRLYVVDNSANLYCLDGRTGQRYWEFSLGRVGKGSPTVTADGVIYVAEQNGVFWILKDEGDHCTVLDREEFTRPDGLIDEINGSPVVVNGRVYFMTRYHTYGLGSGTSKTSTRPAAPLAAESRGAQGMIGAVQVWPAEVTVAPGQSVRFTAVRFDADGVRMERIEPTWSVAGVSGTIGGDGLFQAVADRSFSAGMVVAKGDGFEGKARVRVVPPVPWEMDFERLAVDSVPPGWLGIARKTKVVERDGGKVLQKLAENPAPPFMRIQPYLTPPIPVGYTIEADLLGTPKGQLFTPDMGLVNTRYTCTLMGGDQTLRLETWSPVPRIRKDVPFAWQTNQWYRMKFNVRLQGDRAIVRGKVWLRDSAEPEAWTAEVEDPFPHREGSAGLYGFSPGTTTKSKGPEVFFDHIKVTPNE